MAVDDIVGAEWAKNMVTSALGNLICGLTFVPAHVAYSQRSLSELAILIVREQAAVAQAKGITVVARQLMDELAPS